MQSISFTTNQFLQVFVLVIAILWSQYIIFLFTYIKVKVILQISHQQEEPTPYLKVDSTRKHLTLYDPTLLSSYEQNQRPTAPKMYAFDAIVNSGGTNPNNHSLV